MTSALNEEAEFNIDPPVEETPRPAQGGPTRPPTVLQVLPALITGGAERGCVDMSRAVVEGGGEAIVASAGGPMTHELTRAGATHITLPVDSKNPLVMRANIGRLAELIKTHHVDIVHARSRAPAWSSYFATRRTKRHFVTTFHGTYSHENAFKRKYNSVMGRGERVIAISEFIAGHIRRLYGLPISSIRVIPRGVDLQKFNRSKVSQERIIGQAANWRLPDGMPVIMLPGRLTRWKGQTVFIEAIEKLGRRDLRCLLVGADQGRSDYRRELETMIEQKGLGEVIHVVDHCDDMPAAYMLTDVVVSASTEPEGFGRVIAEAQALGRPVIGTDHGGARETIIEGKTGWLAPPRNPEALAGVIEKVLARPPEARETLAANAMDHIRKNYSKDNMCSKTLDVYNEVLAGETSAP